MLEPRTVLVPIFLAAQGFLMLWVTSTERPPAAPDFSRFPAEAGEWKQVREDMIAAVGSGQFGADSVLSRTYMHSPTSSPASLFVAWFHSQRTGASQQHSPQVCLPGWGWKPEVTGQITLNTQDGAIAVNRFVVAKGPERAVVLYWYQTPRRAITGEWEAKLWLVFDALRYKRTDTALVRVLTWSTGRTDAAASAEAIDFTRNIYPLLRDYLPH